MPIWYVVVEYVRQRGLNYIVFNIVKVIAADIDDVSELYGKEVAPLVHDTGRQLSTMIFIREPDNPFRGFKNA
jgi:hypothetical protein